MAGEPERDPRRIPEVLGALRAAWERHPDWRLGQLLVNVLDARPNPLFVVEDEALVAALGEAATPSPPSPDPAALWALVRRWREEARRDDLAAYGVLMSASGALRLEAAAVARRRLANELAALLPPETP